MQADCMGVHGKAKGQISASNKDCTYRERQVSAPVDRLTICPSVTQVGRSRVGHRMALMEERVVHAVFPVPKMVHKEELVLQAAQLTQKISKTALNGCLRILVKFKISGPNILSNDSAYSH